MLRPFPPISLSPDKLYYFLKIIESEVSFDKKGAGVHSVVAVGW
jgi:hypothetical protein